MEDHINEKLENLMKYLPFIDFILKLDQQKYFKFIDIKKWIATKKRYPLSDLQKIEQSLITQYKNLLLVDHKIPKEIMGIFSGEIKHQFVSLCSEDEEEYEKENDSCKNKTDEKSRSSSKKNHTERKKEVGKHTERKKNEVEKHTEKKEKTSSSLKPKDKQTTNVFEDDDDLQIVSFEYLPKEAREQPKKVSEEAKHSNKDDGKPFKKDSPKKEIDLDEISAELLRKIDVLDEDDNKYNNFHEPINYHKHSDDDDNKKEVMVNLFQRRKSIDLLFKRRDDFKDVDDLVKEQEVKTQPKTDKKHTSRKHKRRNSNKSKTATIETISLDSSSSSESEESNQPTTSAKALPANKTIVQTTTANTKTTNKDNESNEPSPSPTNTLANNLDVDEMSIDVNSSLNSANHKETQPSGDTIKTDLTSDRVICSTKTSIEDSTVTSTNSNHSLDDAVIDLLDMDLDTENDLNDVLNEIENSTEITTKNTNVQEDKAPVFRNPSPPIPPPPPPQQDTTKSAENNSNTPSTTDAQTNSSATSNVSFNNLTQEQILNIFENIQSKSDFEIDALLTTLSKFFNKQHNPSNGMYGTTTNVLNPNDVTPPAPHIIPTIPSPLQHTPVQPPQQQQPIFYPNPIMPTQLQPPQSIYHLHHPQQQQYPPQHRYGLNINDPRIVKNLNLIYKSHLWSELVRQNAGNLISQCQQNQQFTTTNYQQHQHPQTQHPQTQHPQTQHPQTQHPLPQHLQHNSAFPPQTPSTSAAVFTPAPINIRRKSGTKTTICYGDYKRRQLEQQEQLKRKLEEEKKRKEDELKAKQADAAKAIEQREYRKQTDEIRSILQSTLEPYKDKISALFGKHNESSSNVSKSAKNDGTTNKSTNSKSQTKNAETPSKTTEKTNSNKSLDNQKQINNKISKIHKELECTFKGFDQLHDYVPKTIDGRRRSSIHARSAILEQLNSEQPATDYSEQSDINCSQPKSIADKRHSSLCQSTNDNSDSDFNSTQSLSGMPKLTSIRSRSSSSDTSLSKSTIVRPKTIGSKRRSSILARSAIEEQLRQQLSDSDSTMSSQTTIDRESHFSRSQKKRRKTFDEPIQATRRVKSFIIRDDESTLSVCTSSDNEGDFENICLVKQQRLKESILKNQPKVVLKRISDDFIKKHSRRKAPALLTSDVLNIHLVESAKAVTVVKPLNPPVAKKTTKLKKFNNDCQMTERSSRFCVLCTSKPSDLTNHYIRKHKTESYVSRLSYSKLEDLAFNTHFAKLQSGKFRSKYLVECPFCDQELVETFMELYDHYSFHTGEFAYQCGHCQLEKPFRSDITAHQKRSKTCRNSNVRVLYRYPPKSHCIYLHYCSICNFVQLNEANILKHLREHHSPREAVQKNVCKCILAAISDAPEINDKPENETIPASNVLEAINVSPIKEVKKSALDFEVDDDDIPVNNEPCSEDIFEEGKFSLEELLQKMHEEPTTSRAPMTVIHCTNNSVNINANNTTTANETNNIPPPAPAPAPTANVVQRHLPMIIKVEPNEVNESLLITPPRSSTSSVTGSILTESAVVNEHSTSKRYPQMTSILTSVEVKNTISPTPPHSSSSTTNSSAAGIMNDPSATQQIPKITKLYPVYEKYHTYPTNVNYLGLYKCMADDCYYSTDSSDEILKHLNDHSHYCLPTEYIHCPYCTISENIQLTATQLIEHICRQHQHMIYQCSICCYRSCEASNVRIHQQQIHADAMNLQIFKCSGTEVNTTEKQSYINEKILENVRNITCPYCSFYKFYNTNLVRQHINQHHKLDVTCLKVYSCIYCEHIEKEPNNIRKHVSIKHPEELPYIYDHNTFVFGAQDTNNYLNISYLAETVDYVEVKPICDSSVDEKFIQDIKPALEEIIKMNEDTVKIRLRKLTTHTGVAPDSLYRCPEPTCGGFFSVYDLWLKHMRVRHCCLECQCPHCPTKAENNNNDDSQHSLMRTLESYAEHFEEHRRHIFVCFHCSITMRTEDMAKQHAVEQHSNFGTMRFEQIRFNINYSYFIMIQLGLHNERVDFLNAFLTILDKRLKDLESIEMQKLKHRWLIQDNAPWIEDFPKFNLNNRRVLKKCIVSDCKFRSRDDDAIFSHLNTTHAPYSTNFNCKKCDKCVPIKNWNDISDHIKLHNDDTIFICGACLHTNACRIKLSEHIREQHSNRDVPVVELIRTSQQTTYIKLAIVFANNQLTFSTIRNCFCCSERSMSGDAFNLHLRRYHKLTLNYFCEWCSNVQFKSLDEVKGHFKNSHPTVNLKIRCELASNSDLIVISLDEFQLSIANEQQEMLMVKVKEEPNDQPADDSDDDVILLEDNDIVIQESLRNQPCEKPKLKCINMNNLLQTPSTSTALNTSGLGVLPNITITKIGEVSTSKCNNYNTTPTTFAYTSSSQAATPATTATINGQNKDIIINLPYNFTQAHQRINNQQDSKRRKVTPANVIAGVSHQNYIRPPPPQINSSQNSTSTSSNVISNVRPIPSIITQNNTRVHTHYAVNSSSINFQYNVNHRMVTPNYNVRPNYNFASNSNPSNSSVNTHYNPNPNINN